jgi:hypothetical protein
VNRKEMLKASPIAAGAPMINLGTFELFGQSNGKYSALPRHTGAGTNKSSNWPLAIS